MIRRSHDGITVVDAVNFIELANLLLTFLLHASQVASFRLISPIVPRPSPNVIVTVEQHPRRLSTTFLSSSGEHALDTNLKTKNDVVSYPTDSKDTTATLSYAALLKVIDEKHYSDTLNSCPFLPVETVSTSSLTRSRLEKDEKSEIFQAPIDPVFSLETVASLRLLAQKYFDQTERNSRFARGVQVADLGSILSSSIQTEYDTDSLLVKDIANALTGKIYPLTRSAWWNKETNCHSQTSGTDIDSSDGSLQTSLLCVTSASVIAGGGCPCAKSAMTALERDAGMFVVHIDLGNSNTNNELVPLLDTTGESTVKGAVYLASLVDRFSGGSESIVGPLNPGQAVIHKSMERTAAIIVPSNLHDLGHFTRANELHSVTRTKIAKAAQSSRHFVLRLVLTTQQACVDRKQHSPFENFESKNVIPEAPPEERSYRLRNFAELHHDRVRFLTLAGLLDMNDHENHLWLGFHYMSRVDDPENEVDIEKQLSDISRAVFYFEKAALLCPTDARAHFQLATALGIKMQCENSIRLRKNKDDLDLKNWDAKKHVNNESIELARIAAEFEWSAQLESSAVRFGIHGIDDLASCLYALTETYCKMGEFQKALTFIDQWAEAGSIQSYLAVEDRNASTINEVPSYEWIQSSEFNIMSEREERKSSYVALQTAGDTPLLDAEDISMLRSAADRRFALANGKQTSRYSMQYDGNSEVHLEDLCLVEPNLKVRMDYLLQNKIYPLVRAAFSEEKGVEDDILPNGSLCVYDSIFVRYNGEKAKSVGRIGASQPLHQDGGIYTVNIALNSNIEKNGLEFSGGGTFFEALTMDDYISPVQRPIAPGHAILHRSTMRHAGAPTTCGVRDILVIFLTVRPSSLSKIRSTWRIERAMRLQSIAKKLPREQLIRCLELARENDPTNSEMSYWLGMHLIQGDMNDPSEERWIEICRGFDSLMNATLLNPMDARAHFYLGMAISTRHKYAMRTKRAPLLPPATEVAYSIIDAFENSVKLEKRCKEYNCENGINLAAAYFNLGDFMARLRNYDKAISYLSQVEDVIALYGDKDEDWAKSMLHDVTSMLTFCITELSRSKEESSANV